MNGYILPTKSIGATQIRGLFGLERYVFSRQLFGEAKGDPEYFSHDLNCLDSLDHAIIALDPQSASLEQLLSVVRDVKNQLPILVLMDGEGPDVLKEFRAAADGGVYSLKVFNWQRSKHLIPKALAELSGEFYGVTRPVLRLSENLNIDRVNRCIVDAKNKFIDGYPPKDFRILEYLGLHFNSPVKKHMLYDFLYEQVGSDAYSERAVDVHMSKLQGRILDKKGAVNVLRSTSGGAPHGYVCLSNYDDYAAIPCRA